MNPREGRTFPAYLFGGRLRTSTLALIVAFAAIWWLYEAYEPAAEPPPQVPASEVVPPGFIPDPAYTWAPRTDFQRQTPTTATTTTTTTTAEAGTPPSSSGEQPPTPSTPGEPTSPAPSSPAPAPSPSTSSPPVTTPVPSAPPSGPVPPAPPPRT